MSYIESMDKVINYIEDNLKKDVEIEVLAGLTYLSKFHFHRLFTHMVGQPLMGYIRKRRMARSANELLETDKTILEIAIDYRFNSNEAFTRAFKRNFGISPSIYRKEKREIFLEEKFNIWNLKLKEGEDIMDVKFVIKQEFKIVGMDILTTIEENERDRSIPKLWDRYIERESEIKNTVKESSMGLCEVTADSEDEFTYICCKEVENFEEVPEGMVTRTVKTAKYAVFTHKGAVDNLGETYDYIYRKWLPNSEYEIISDGYDFELYDERFDNTENSELDIYIPVK